MRHSLRSLDPGQGRWSVCLAALLVLAPAPALAQSDDCASATPIADEGTFFFTTIVATDSQLPLPSCNNQLAGLSSDVWFLWAAGAGSAYDFALCTSDYDSVLAIYDTCGGLELACDDGFQAGCGNVPASSSDTLIANFAVVPGANYLVRIDGWAGDQGSGALDVTLSQPPPRPAGDDCTAPITITGHGSFAFDTQGATTDGAPHPLCDSFGSDQVHNDVWFTWTAANAGRSLARTCDATGFDTRLAVYDGSSCPLPGSAPLACNDDACGPAGLASRLEFDVIQGATYLLRVGGGSPLASGTGELTLEKLFSTIGTPYCHAFENSASPTGAHIAATGTTSVAFNDLGLRADDLPPGVSGLFFFGDAQIQTPFGDGLRCVGGAVQRYPSLAADALGTVLFDPDLTVPNSFPWLAAGTTWNFQFWYRDPSTVAQGGAGFNLTNAVEVTFGP